MIIRDRLVLIPDWIQDMLRSYNLTLDALTDTAKLSRILMKEDLSYYVVLHKLMQMHLFKPLISTLPLVDHTMLQSAKSYGYGSTSAATMLANSADYQLTDLTRTLSPSQQAQYCIKGMLRRSATIDLNDIGLNQYVFELVPIKDGIHGLKIKQIDSARSYGEQYSEACDKALDFIQHYYDFESVALTPIFSEFVRVSSGLVRI